jgi:hypothetical protein
MPKAVSRMSVSSRYHSLFFFWDKGSSRKWWTSTSARKGSIFRITFTVQIYRYFFNAPAGSLKKTGDSLKRIETGEVIESYPLC